MEVIPVLETKYHIDLPAFTGRNVPIAEIAKATGKDAQYIRIGLQQGIFKFGYAVRSDNSSEYNYFCPDRKVWEETGYFKQDDTLEDIANTRKLEIHKQRR
jgi:hypothetical protein